MNFLTNWFLLFDNFIKWRPFDNSLTLILFTPFTTEVFLTIRPFISNSVITPTSIVNKFPCSRVPFTFNRNLPFKFSSVGKV